MSGEVLSVGLTKEQSVKLMEQCKTELMEQFKLMDNKKMMGQSKDMDKKLDKIIDMLMMQPGRAEVRDVGRAEVHNVGNAEVCDA